MSTPAELLGVSAAAAVDEKRAQFCATETSAQPPAFAETDAEFAPVGAELAAFLKTFLAPSERPGAIGRLGDYHILGVLGAGGMGLENEDTPPPRTDTPRYPAANGENSYGLREGTGLWVFAVVASEKPLPAYEEWLSERLGNQSPWQPMPTVPSEIVWWDDGVASVDYISASGVARTLRGKDELLEGPAATIKRLTDSLRVKGQVETASAIGFGVAP